MGSYFAIVGNRHSRTLVSKKSQFMSYWKFREAGSVFATLR